MVLSNSQYMQSQHISVGIIIICSVLIILACAFIVALVMVVIHSNEKMIDNRD